MNPVVSVTSNCKNTCPFPSNVNVCPPESVVGVVNEALDNPPLVVACLYLVLEALLTLIFGVPLPPSNGPTVTTVEITTVSGVDVASPDTAVGLNPIPSVVIFSILESAPFFSAFSPRTLNANVVPCARLLKVWAFVTLVLPTAPFV